MFLPWGTNIADSLLGPLKQLLLLKNCSKWPLVNFNFLFHLRPLGSFANYVVPSSFITKLLLWFRASVPTDRFGGMIQHRRLFFFDAGVGLFRVLVLISFYESAPVWRCRKPSLKLLWLINNISVKVGNKFPWTICNVQNFESSLDNVLKRLFIVETKITTFLAFLCDRLTCLITCTSRLFNGNRALENACRIAVS